MTIHKHKFRVGFQDTDNTGRIYFPSYVRWFDIAFIELLRENDVVFNPVGNLIINGEKTGLSLVVGEYCCRISKPSKYDDVVTVYITVKEIRDKVVVSQCRLIDESNGDELANGWIAYVCVDLSNNRSATIPQKLREVFEQYRA